MDLTSKFLSFALLGANWVLWVLILLSIASLAIVIERLIFYGGMSGTDTGLAKSLGNALARRDYMQAKSLVKGATGPGARMVASILDGEAKSAAAASALVDAARPAEKFRLERNLAFLGTVGSNAPFIGLFGTVLEILRVFNLLGEQGVTSGGEAAKIMTGISEALVATAIGLLVAIPAVIAYNALQRRVKSLMSQGEGLVNMALALIADHPPMEGAPVTAEPAVDPKAKAKKPEAKKPEAKKAEDED